MKHKICVKLPIVLTFLYSLTFSSYSQEISCNFENGNNSEWIQESPQHWTSSTSSPISGSKSLKHNISKTPGTSYISHDISGLNLATQNITWQFNLKNGNWDPTASNKFWVYLTSNESNLSSSTLDGYAIGVNLKGKSDFLTLWKVTNGTADESIITTAIDWNSNEVKGIKITRNINGQWEILVDENGGFDSLIPQGTAINNDYLINDYFGFHFTYTKTRAGLLWIDDVLVKETVPSTNPNVTFDKASSSNNETNATFNTSIPVTFSNHTNDLTVSISVNPNSNAELTDYKLNTSSLTFTENGTQNISLDINDDIDTDNETIILDISLTSGNSDINIGTHTVTIVDNDLPEIVINEILADPTGIDANGDGIISTSQDEFIELVNTDIIPHNLAGYTISDSNSVKHTFNSVTIPAGGSIVIFGGGTPTYISGISIIAKAKNLSLNNTGDTVTLKNTNGTIITTYTYGKTANSDQSIARNKDLIGDFITHSSITSNPVSASPGRYNVTNLPFSTITWKGTTNSNWNTPTNWSTGNIPNSSDAILIPKTPNQPTIHIPTTIKSIILESGTSMIANATVTGNVTYKRNLATNNWYFISSPVNGETTQNLRANNTFANGKDKKIGISTYKNDGTKWNYLTNTSTGIITTGKGYSVKLESPGDISFTGSINTNTINYPITQAFNNFNLVGNPFTSYVNLGTFFNDNQGSVFSEATIWLWNQATNSYDTKMLGTDANFQLPPGQAFFVSAGTTNTAVTFNTTNQSHQTDTFQRNFRTEIHLMVKENNISKSTKLYFIDGTTTGFDNGYDGTLFGGSSSKTAIYSQLISNDKGKKLAIQSLPLNNMKNMIVPIGIKELAGKELQFSAKTMNLPVNINVYLEDKVNHTFTNLSKKNYTVTLSTNLNGIGQFYIHTAYKEPENNSIQEPIENIHFYKSSKSELTITGPQTEKATLTIFSILGKEILTKAITPFSGNSKVVIPKITAGIYIIELTSKLGKFSKKIILE